MKKNFSVNIYGRLFNIDEDAYELLEQYFQFLEKSFENEAEKQEIIDDFQKRISDQFWEFSKSDPQHIIELPHVKKVLADLGYFSANEEDQKQEHTARSAVKRLFRNPDDRIFGGVCGGIAVYFNIDPLIVRILFVVFTLIFAIGLLAYIILWIVVPLAVSPIEKLNMSGDEITLDKVKDILKTEFKEVEKSFKDLKKKGIARDKFSGFEKEIREFVNASLFFRVFAGSLLIAISLFLLSGLIILLLTPFHIGTFFGVELTSFSQVGNLLFNSAFLGKVFKWSLFIVFFIPFSGILFFGISFLTGVNFKTGIIRWISQYIGTASLLVFLFCIVYIYLHFIFVDKKETVYLYNEGYFSEIKFEIDEQEIQTANVLSGIPELSVVPGGDTLKAIVQKRSYGRTSVQAAENNSRIMMDVFSNKDTLFVGPFWMTDQVLWRGQNVKIIIEVPVGKRISISGEFASHFLPRDISETGKKRYRYRMTETGPVKF